MQVTVTKRFFDKRAGRFRNPEDRFEADAARIAEIEAALPGYVAPAQAAPTAASRKADIVAYLRNSGVELDETMTKAELLALIEGHAN